MMTEQQSKLARDHATQARFAFRRRWQRHLHEPKRRPANPRYRHGSGERPQRGGHTRRLKNRDGLTLEKWRKQTLGSDQLTHGEQWLAWRNGWRAGDVRGYVERVR